MKKKGLFCILMSLSIVLIGCGKEKSNDAKKDNSTTKTQVEQVIDDEKAVTKTTANESNEEETEPSKYDENDFNEDNLGKIEAEREAYASLVYYSEGDPQTIPIKLYTGRGYSIYIPDKDFTLAEDDNVSEDKWVCTKNDMVEIKVNQYTGNFTEARDAFLKKEGITIEELICVNDYPVYGYEEDADKSDDCLRFIIFEGDSISYVISWKLTLDALEGYGTILSYNAFSFRLTE